MDDEMLEILDLLKDKDIKLEDLWIRVYDMESAKEGWISIAQLLKLGVGE